MRLNVKLCSNGLRTNLHSALDKVHPGMERLILFGLIKYQHSHLLSLFIASSLSAVLGKRSHREIGSVSCQAIANRIVSINKINDRWMERSVPISQFS